MCLQCAQMYTNGLKAFCLQVRLARPGSMSDCKFYGGAVGYDQIAEMCRYPATALVLCCNELAGAESDTIMHSGSRTPAWVLILSSRMRQRVWYLRATKVRPCCDRT
jgi:hypothetical protein